MANWCSNTVVFGGDPANILKAVQLIKEISYDDEKQNSGKLPTFLGKDSAHLFEFGLDMKSLSFRTAWTPDIDTVRKIAAHFGLDYTHSFQEAGMRVYGEAGSRTGVFDMINIEAGDLKGIGYDEHNDTFLYEGRSYDSDWVIMREVLDIKRELSMLGRPMVSIDRPYTPEELLGWRLTGCLPRIDIDGTDFIVDWADKELREAEKPWNVLDLSSMELSDTDNGYLSFYDTVRHKVYEPDPGLIILPQNVVMLEIPGVVDLDPVGIAREHGLPDHAFIANFPIRQGLRATVVPLSETCLPDLIAENLSKQSRGRGIRP